MSAKLIGPATGTPTPHAAHHGPSAETLEGFTESDYRVGVSELIPPDFMRAHTRFPRIDTVHALFAAYPPLTSAQDDASVLAILGSDEWNAFIREHTRFASWETMLQAAAADWMRRRLFGGPASVAARSAR